MHQIELRIFTIPRNRLGMVSNIFGVYYKELIKSSYRNIRSYEWRLLGRTGLDSPAVVGGSPVAFLRKYVWGIK